MPKPHYKRAQTRLKIEFDRKTVGEILNRLQYNNQLRAIVRNK